MLPFPFTIAFKPLHGHQNISYFLFYGVTSSWLCFQQFFIDYLVCCVCSQQHVVLFILSSEQHYGIYSTTFPFDRVEPKAQILDIVFQ